MSSDCSFAVHIDAVVALTKSTILWILQTFQTRECLPMLTLWKTLVLPIDEYCAVLWSPTKVGHIQQIESLQWSFLRKIRGCRSSYWESLTQYNIYSLQRRRERYQIIYIWKILDGQCPNIQNAVQACMHIRDGRKCVVPHNRNLSFQFTEQNSSMYC